MPWTILPSLIVLWGVCWMFIIGSQAVDHETLTPTFSPTPAAEALFDASFTADLQSADPSTVLFGFPIDDQDPFNCLFPDEAADHTMNPLDWANGSPQDPNFLTAGVIPDDQVDPNGLGIIHGSVAKAQSNEVLRVNGLPDSESLGSEGTPNASQSAPLSCSDIPGSLVHLEDHEQDGFGHHMSQEKPRLENKDDGPENEQLLADMKKKLLRLTDEIEKKERELAADKNARDSLEKAVLALEGS
ncbi:hypothetical protein NW768_010015 [Fusarium equiseti]|uniref:Transcription factor n=1 Tax=Fusarium equiseti TaxID=61235 RepID=A0ABQ8R1Z3_FUSEQ|nr:hypothetical protein NW768_010015 [Fusarium equiseti]